MEGISRNEEYLWLRGKGNKRELEDIMMVGTCGGGEVLKGAS